MISEAQAVALIEPLVPESVRLVCERLSSAGHQAFTVGGAVRDAILGRRPGDWDVATSASPQEVMGEFRRTIPTGIKHGTVTVVVGRGDRRLPVEVTTFRGDGAYSDGRRPDSVVFGVPLREDLARRDLVINAMAYDPVAGVLADPFGGRRDIDRRRIRAVGEPERRFSEDGLRVMRAIRFAAVLEFDLDPATEAAIPAALPILARVSRERVRVELMKMLAAPVPSRGLAIARRTGVLEEVLPELAHWPPVADDGDTPGRGEQSWRRTLARVDAAGDALVGLAALLIDAPEPLPPARSEAHPLRRLKFSNAEIERADRMLGFGRVWSEDHGDAGLRALLGRLGRDHVDDVLALWRAEECALRRGADAESTAAAARVRAASERVSSIIAAGDALTTGDLALSGGDIIRILGIRPGPVIGVLMARLLAVVLEHPERNTPEKLTEVLHEVRSTE